MTQYMISVYQPEGEPPPPEVLEAAMRDVDLLPCSTRRSRYRVPTEADLPERVKAVLAVVYLIFNEGYAASSGDRLIREDLCGRRSGSAGCSPH